MTKMAQLLLTVSFSLVLISFSPLVLGDDPKSKPEGQTEAWQDQSATGELKSVDPDAMKLVITTSEGADMEFLYTENTEILGAQGNVEGLSASPGSKVKVFYKEENGSNTATKIKVKQRRDS
jgi:Cu/Ag efflux protein CusF